MDGIALLQRSSPGWALVGDAYPDNPELAAEMAKLRAAADALAPEGATFKVVIPNDQIRYLSIPAGPADPVLRRRAVETALDGATPYALDELAIDHTIHGDTLQIAAAALETLQEADRFARSYGFDPVSFVALPEGRDYSGEPFFGTAHDVPDSVNVEKDRIAMRISGRVKMPAPAPKAPPAAAVPSSAPTAQGIESPKADPAAQTDSTGDTPPGDAAAAPISFSSVRSRSPQGDAPSDTPRAPLTADRDAAAAERSQPPRITISDPPAGAAKAPAGKQVFVPQRDIQPEELSASLQAEESPPPATRRGPAIGAALAAGAAGLFAKAGTAVAARRAARAKAREAKAALARDEAAFKAELAAAQLEVPQQAEGITSPTQPAPKPGKTAQPAPAPDVTPTSDAAPDDAPAKPKGKGKAKGKSAKAKTPPPTPVIDPAPVPAPPLSGPARTFGALSPEERRAEEERLTVFGARNGTYDTGGGGSVGVAIGIVAALFLTGAVAWAALFRDEPLSALVRGEDAAPEEVAALPEEERIAAQAPVQDTFVPPAPSDPEEVTQAEEATTPETADETPVEDAPQAVAEETPAEEDTTEPVSPLIVTEAATAPPEDTAAAPADTGTGTTAEDEAHYAASGIWQTSPEGIDSTTSGASAAAPDAQSDPDAPPTPAPDVRLSALTPDARPDAPFPPPVYGQRFNMDDRGFVIATPDGVRTPQGVLVYSGQPPLQPPPRPGETVQPAADDAAADPEPEPASDAQLSDPEPAPAATGAPPDDRFAAVRPQLRPGSATEEAPVPAEAAPQPAADTATQDDVAIASGASLAGGAVRSGTERGTLIDDTNRASIAAGLAAGATSAEDAAAAEAIADPEADAQSETEAAADGIEPAFVALRPRQRPGNIDELVAAVKPAPPPAIAPSGPTAVSVARQATVRDALDLTRMNLIGVYGDPADRRALVRLANGRYRKVKVGDRIDGGRVLAIGEDTLRYQKDGRNLTLNMPSG